MLLGAVHFTLSNIVLVKFIIVTNAFIIADFFKKNLFFKKIVDVMQDLRKVLLEISSFSSEASVKILHSTEPYQTVVLYENSV